jgi:hypothetical protein
MRSADVAATGPSIWGRPLLQVTREIGRHLATMHRWRTRGVLDASGIRRRLRMTRVGGRWFVTDDDLAAFFAALNEGQDDPQRPPVDPTRPAEWATRELIADGI